MVLLAYRQVLQGSVGQAIRISPLLLMINYSCRQVARSTNEYLLGILDDPRASLFSGQPRS